MTQANLKSALVAAAAKHTLAWVNSELKKVDPLGGRADELSQTGKAAALLLELAQASIDSMEDFAFIQVDLADFAFIASSWRQVV